MESNIIREVCSGVVGEGVNVRGMVKEKGRRVVRERCSDGDVQLRMTLTMTIVNIHVK